MNAIFRVACWDPDTGGRTMMFRMQSDMTIMFGMNAFSYRDGFFTMGKSLVFASQFVDSIMVNESCSLFPGFIG